MRRLLQATAIIEACAGVALLAVPGLSVMLLLELALQGTAAVIVARIGGAGLLALGIACGLASHDAGSHAAKGLVVGMLLYNVAATFVLGDAAVHNSSAGVILWLAVTVHVVMTGWCLSSIFKTHLPPHP